MSAMVWCSIPFFKKERKKIQPEVRHIFQSAVIDQRNVVDQPLYRIKDKSMSKNNIVNS